MAQVTGYWLFDNNSNDVVDSSDDVSSNALSASISTDDNLPLGSGSVDYPTTLGTVSGEFYTVGDGTYFVPDDETGFPPSENGNVVSFTEANADAKILGHWNFDDSADALDDTSESDNDALLKGDTEVDDGAVEFDGSGDYVEIPHSSDYHVDSATIEVTFTVDNLGGSQALISRDSHGFDGGGHFTLRIEDDGTIWLRHQSDSKSYYIENDSITITPGQEHTLTYSFGPENGMELHLDGQLVGTNDDPVTEGANISLSQNDEPWTLGASQWQSSDGAADNLTHYFDGTISDFTLYQGELTPLETAKLNDQVDGTSGDDAMTLGFTDADGDQITTGDDVIVAGDGYDTVDGDAGNDYIAGGAGNDSLLGGAGNDTIFGGSDSDTLRGGTGSDVLYGGDGLDVFNIHATDETTVVDGGSSWDTIVFHEADDTPSFSASHTIASWGGSSSSGSSDSSSSSVGSLGGSSSSEGVNVVFSGDGEGKYELGDASGTFSSIEIVQTTNNDDTVDASDASSSVTILGEDGNDTILGGSGNDLIQGGADSDTLSGGGGNDTLRGQDGADSLVGGTGDDYLDGGADADTLVGGLGDDELKGGDGSDEFWFADGGGADTIADFVMDDKQVDQLNVSGLTNALGTPVSVKDVTVTSDEFGNAVLNFPGGETIKLTGINPATLTDPKLISMGIPCFTKGTRILTPRGEVPIETLKVGDRVQTLDNGLQPIRWIGQRRLSQTDLRAAPKLRPVRIKAGSLGNARDLIVSPQHGMVVTPENGTPELARAIHLARNGGPGFHLAHGVRQVTYFHLMFERHEIIFAEGAPSESFYPGPIGFGSLQAAEQAEIAALFPELLISKDITQSYGATARTFAKRRALSANTAEAFDIRRACG